MTVVCCALSECEGIPNTVITVKLNFVYISSTERDLSTKHKVISPIMNNLKLYYVCSRGQQIQSYFKVSMVYFPENANIKAIIADHSWNFTIWQWLYLCFCHRTVL